MIQSIIYHSLLLLKMLAFDKEAAAKIRFDEKTAQKALILPIIISIVQIGIYAQFETFLNVMPVEAWAIYCVLFNCGWLFYFMIVSKIAKHLDRLQGFKNYLMMYCLSSPLQFIVLMPLFLLRGMNTGGDLIQSISLAMIVTFGYILQWILIRNYLKIPAIGAIGLILLFDIIVEYIPGFLIALHVAKMG